MSNGDERLYNDGSYLIRNPGWHAGDSLRKARELFTLLEKYRVTLEFPGAVLQVAEVGCGFGGVLANLTALLEARWQVQCRAIGIDISREAIAHAEEQYGKKIDFFVGNISRVPDTTDLLIVVDLVEHLASPDDFLRQAWKKGSYVLFRFPLELNLWNVVFGKRHHLKENLGHLHFYTVNTVLKLLENHNYDLVDYAYTNNFSSPANRKTVIAALMARVRATLSVVSQKANSLLLGGNSLVVLVRSGRK